VKSTDARDAGRENTAVMHTVTIGQTEIGDEAVTQVVRWRFQQLRRGGYGAGDATAIAVQTGVDLHRAVELLKRGCPADLALRILA
jgi:hypothetical protein